MHADRYGRTSSATIALLVVAVFGPSPAPGFSSGPPDGATGAPGEFVCTQCHTEFGLNSGPGLLTIDAPVEYEPGMTYAIAVSVTQVGQMRWGFELTVLDGEGEQGGDLLPIDANTQVSASLGREYIKHTSAGTMPGQTDGNTFTFAWSAPESDLDALTFYAAGNAANNDASNQGDFIYTASTPVPEPTAVARSLGLLAAPLAIGWARRPRAPAS